MFKPGCINQPANSTMILRCASSREKLPQGNIAKLSNAIHIICQAQRTINHSLLTVTYRLTLVLSVLIDKADMGSFFGLFETSSVRPSQDLNLRRYCSKATA